MGVSHRHQFERFEMHSPGPGQPYLNYSDNNKINSSRYDNATMWEVFCVTELAHQVLRTRGGKISATEYQAVHHLQYAKRSPVSTLPVADMISCPATGSALVPAAGTPICACQNVRVIHKNCAVTNRTIRVAFQTHRQCLHHVP